MNIAWWFLIIVLVIFVVLGGIFWALLEFVNKDQNGEDRKVT